MAGDDPSNEVADTQAPAHLEERGVDPSVESALDEDGERRRRAAKSLLAAKPMPVADWPEMERELDERYAIDD